MSVVEYPWYTCPRCRERVTSGHHHDCAPAPQEASVSELAERVEALEARLAELTALVLGETQSTPRLISSALTSP